MRPGTLARLRAVPPNELVLYRDVAFQAVVEAGAITFLPVLLVRLGAPDWLVGLEQALPALVMTLASLPMAALVQRQRSLVATTNWGRFLFRLGLAMFALVMFLPNTYAIYTMVFAYSLLFIPASASNVAFVTILGQATSPQRRPRMLSTRLAIHGLFAALAGFSAGLWLGGASYPLNYQMLFVSALVAGMGGILMLARLEIPERQAARRAAEGHPPSALRDIWALVKANPPFRSYCLATFVFRLSMSMPMALYSIYRVRELGASDYWLGVVFTVERVLSVVVYFVLGRLLARPAVQRRLWLSCLAVALYPLTMALARSPVMLLIPHICGAVFGSAMNVYLTNTLFRASPEEGRPSFVAVDATLANITSFAGPLLGTALAGISGLSLALLIIAGLRVLGGLSFWRLKVGIEG